MRRGPESLGVAEVEPVAVAVVAVGVVSSGVGSGACVGAVTGARTGMSWTRRDRGRGRGRMGRMGVKRVRLRLAWVLGRDEML